MRILRWLLIRRLCSPCRYLGRTLALLASFLLLSMSATFTPVYAAATAKTLTVAWHTFHDPVYGFSLMYPGTWTLTTEKDGSHITLLNPATKTTISPIVSTQTGAIAAILKKNLPAQSVDRQTRTVAGHQSTDYLLPYVSAARTQGHDAVDIGGPQQSRVVTIPVTNTAGTVNVYTFLLNQPTSASGKISTAEQADQRTFEAILNTFTLPTKVILSHAANTTGCDQVCWADNNWSYNFYDDSSYEYCDSAGYNESTLACIDGNLYGTQVPSSGSYFQPYFECAEFVARAITQNGMVPGLNNGGVNGSFPVSSSSSYGSYGNQGYDLLNVGVSGLLGLHDYLLDSGLATNIGENISQAQPGDVIFFNNGSGTDYYHTMIITSVADGGLYLDGHNAAEYHRFITSADYSGDFDIYHFPTAYHHMSGFSQFGTTRYQLHSDGSIYVYQGTPLTGWQELDNNPKAVAIVTDGTGHLYQLHSDGSIYFYKGTPMTGWQELDNNPKAVAIAADGTGHLYQLHSDGSIYLYKGTPMTGWQELDTNPKAVAIATDGTGHLYQLHSDGSIYLYKGTPLTGWQKLDTNPKTIAIAADGVGNLYQLHSDGSIYIYQGTPLTGWLKLDTNPKTIAIAVDRTGNLYQLHSDGSIYIYQGTPLTGWLKLDTNPKTIAIAADGTGDLYQLHSDGSIYLYKGTPLTGWQKLDTNPKTVALSGAY